MKKQLRALIVLASIPAFINGAAQTCKWWNPLTWGECWRERQVKKEFTAQESSTATNTIPQTVTTTTEKTVQSK